MKIFLTLITIIATLVSKAHATEVDNGYIEIFAKKYIQQHLNNRAKGKLTIQVAKIDPRVKLTSCENHLTANIPENFNGRNVNIKISCADSISWSIYLTAKITTVIPVIVAKKSISAGTLLDDSNITSTYLDSYKIRGTFVGDINKVKGTKAKRKIIKDHLITLINTCTVCEGSQVTIIAQSKQFTIRTNGEALDSGNIGEQISVKNNRSGKIINARVNAINKVVINL
jgi:flagella basal body P-ring formation protein FlgA